MAEELCIRFVNTVAWRLRDMREERLGTPEALFCWLVDNDLAAPEDIRPAESAAAEIHAEAIALREAIYRVFQSQIAGIAPPADQIAVLNGWLAEPAPGVALAYTGNAVHWRPSPDGGSPRDLLRPVALSAAELITGPRAGRVRQCEDTGGCGWLFVDESRAQNRRWCSMGDCGNRAKAARHRVKKRAAAASDA
jgi:predicted RNA-binding Zn ribbon-like protein